MNNVLSNETQTNVKPVFEDIDMAADAILAQWEDADKPSETETEEASEQQDNETNEPDVDEILEQDSEEVDLEEAEDSGTEEEPETEAQEIEEVEITDDLEVEVLVDGKSSQISIGQLKRLAGQEKALTRKSQETAAQRKQAEDLIGKTDVVLKKMLERAEERYKPYSEVDMLIASKQLSDEDFAQLRKEATDAETEVKFLQQEADQFYKDLQAEQQKQLQSAAQEAIKVLKNDIPGWSETLYNDIRKYAVSEGLPEAQVNAYVDPSVIKILNKARLYDQAKNVSTVKKKRVAKVLKTKKAPPTKAQVSKEKEAQIRQKLRQSTDIQDVADVFLQRWGVEK